MGLHIYTLKFSELKTKDGFLVRIFRSINFSYFCFEVICPKRPYVANGCLREIEQLMEHKRVLKINAIAGPWCRRLSINEGINGRKPKKRKPAIMK